MNRTTEKIPTWSLAYIINGDATALTDYEVQTIDRWMEQWQVQDVSPLTDKEGNAQPYFTHYPPFGLHERNRPFQTNHTDVFGAESSGR